MGQSGHSDVYKRQVAGYAYDAVQLLENQKTNGKDEIMEEYDTIPRVMMTKMCIRDSFYSANQTHFARKDDCIYQILGLIRDNLSLPTGRLLELIAEELSLNPQYINRLRCV